MFSLGCGQAAKLTDSGQVGFKLPVDFLVERLAQVGCDGVEEQRDGFEGVVEKGVDGLATLKCFWFVSPKFLAYHWYIETAQAFQSRSRREPRLQR